MSLWEERCNDVVHHLDPKKKLQTLHIISHIKPFLFEMYRQHGQSPHFKQIIDVLRSSKNCTKDTKPIISVFIDFCVDDAFCDFNPDKYHHHVLIHWKLLSNLGQNSRSLLLDTFRDELDIHKQSIAHQNDIVVLEKTKDHVVDELDKSKKQLSIMTIERDRFRSQYLKLKQEFDSIKESNIQLHAKLSKCEHFEETNKTLLAIISNISSSMN